MVKSVFAARGVEPFPLMKFLGAWWLLLLGVWIATGENLAFADSCAQSDCIEINAWTSDGTTTNCFAMYTDAAGTTKVTDCLMCGPGGNYWCLDQDPKKACTKTDEDIWNLPCKSKTCTLSCPDHAKMKQQATVTAVLANKGFMSKRWTCQPKVSGN